MRGDEASDQHEHNSHDSSGQYQSFGRSVLFKVTLVEVHREYGRCRIQHGVERAHDCSEDGREHEALQTRGNQILDQKRIGRVRSDQLVSVELKSHYARKDNDERNQQFQPGGEDHSHLSLLQAPGAEGSLHDVLVKAPIIEVRDPDPEEKRCPGDFDVAGGKDHMKPVGIRLKKVIHTADRDESEDHGDYPSDDQRRALDEVCPDNGFESAVSRVKSSDDAYDPHR